MIKDFADEVVAAVRAEGKQRFDLVGGSLGAAVATCIAAEYPEMVRSLVLVSGFSHGSDPRMNLQFKLWLRLVSTDQIVPPAYSENLVPDAKTVELNSGHLIFLEKPVELASAILSFCQ